MARIGVYPGTFDPIHFGHIDIIQRGAKLVDKLIIAVAINENKKPLFSLDERVAMLRHETDKFSGAQYGEIEILPFQNLITEFAAQNSANMIVRGLRGTVDFDYEFQMAGMNSVLQPGIETVFLMAASEHQAIASSLVREIAKMGGDVSAFTPKNVRDKLTAKFAG